MLESKSSYFILYGDQDFFFNHGLFLSITWIFLCTAAMLLKKVNVVYHAIGFIVVDIVTAYFVIGAWVNIWPDIGSLFSWRFIVVMHIICANIVVLVLIYQNYLGIMIRLGHSSEGRRHKIIAFIVSNAFRTVASVGWIMQYKQNSAFFVVMVPLITVVFLGYSVLTTFYQFKRNTWYGLGNIKIQQQDQVYINQQEMYPI